VAQQIADTSDNFEIPLRDRTKPCRCGGTMYWERGCGAYVCNGCEAHDGLARCFCGWSLTSGNGRAELEEMGETIDPEDGGFFDAAEFGDGPGFPEDA
jgi:hypothetical protein